MRRLIAVIALMFIITMAMMAGSALADSPVRPPGSPPPAHPHHVHKGNGGCVDINSVFFVPHPHGLHQGSTASGPNRGPFHGSCH